MSSYHLPIVLGQNQAERIVVIHLVDDQEQYEENRVVIVSPAGKSTPLFRISDQAQLIDLSGGLVRPQFDKGSNLLEVSVGGKTIIPRRFNGFWNYRVSSGVFDADVTFSITMKGDDGSDTTLEGQLHIVRPSDGEMVMNINADLGSDATQINYYIPGSGVVGSQKVNLVQCFKNGYKPNRTYDDLVRPESKEPLFIQQEKGTKDFYKTGNITFKIDGDINASLSDGNTFINYINVSAAGKNEIGNTGKGTATWDKENAFNRKLINIKMLYAHRDIPEVVNPVEDINFKDDGVTKEVSNPQNLLQVLQAIYKQLISISNLGMNGKCNLFSVLLLVPNIYIQANIDLLLYEMSKMNKNDDGRKYDFRVISESDSAFVGIKEARMAGGNQNPLSGILNNVRDPRQKDTFLIIDAGKGTTDFSIVRYDPNPNGAANSNLISLKRGGIVGAGGAIDYVFARVFARQVYNHRNEIVPSTICKVTKSQFIHRFMTLIEKLTPVDQDRVMLIVEMLKKKYKGGDKARTAQVYTCFAGTSAKTIVSALLGDSEPELKRLVETSEAWKEISQWVWGNQTIEVDQDDMDEVERVCRAIAQTVTNEMIFVNKDDSLNRQIDYVIFNGRSFLFEPLKKAFVDAIEPNRGIWYENHGFSVYAKRLRPRESYYNLKIAPLSGFNMKSVSVEFEQHDLGVNCNSDLCCTERIQFQEGILEQDQFWHGFDIADDGGQEPTRYYIGYVNNGLARSFAPELSQGVTVNTISETPEKFETRKQLVLMTLFPVSYVPVFADPVNQPGTTSTTQTPTGPTPTTPTPAGPTAGPAIPTPKSGTNGIDNNSLSIPSGNQNGKPVANDDHLDINDL